MKFSSVTAACLATGVYARSAAEPPTRVLERDIATVTGAVQAVGENIVALDSAIKGFSGELGPVHDAADKLVSTLKDSKTKVDGSDKLTLTDAVSLQQPVKDLQSKSETLASDLKERKSLVEKGGFCGLVRVKVSEINSNSLALIKSIIDKVPTEAQSIAEGLASGFKKSLAQAQSDFSENCKNSGGGSSSASAPASSSARVSEPASSAEPSEPASSAEPTSSGYAVPTSSAAATSPYQPTGTGVPSVTSSHPPMVTAGAAALVAPVGALAMAAAALML